MSGTMNKTENKMEKKKIGVIGVDAGLCWVGDPCYVLHKSDEEKYKSIGENWSEFCNIMGSNNHKQFTYDLGHDGLGVCVTTGYGDGNYPVYGYFNKDNRISKIEIDFEKYDSVE